MAKETNVVNSENMPKMNYGPMQLDNEEKEEIREVSIINQAVFLYRRQDEFLKQCQDLHDRAAMTYDPSGNVLISIYHKFRHAYMTTKFAMMDRDSSRIDKKLKEITSCFHDVSEKGGKANQGKIDQQAYSEIHGLLYDALELLYEGNQRSGMGMPKETRMGRASRIKEAMDQ